MFCTFSSRQRTGIVQVPLTVRRFPSLKAPERTSLGIFSAPCSRFSSGIGLSSLTHLLCFSCYSVANSPIELLIMIMCVTIVSCTNYLFVCPRILFSYSHLSEQCLDGLRSVSLSLALALGQKRDDLLHRTVSSSSLFSIPTRFTDSREGENDFDLTLEHSLLYLWFVGIHFDSIRLSVCERVSFVRTFEMFFCLFSRIHHRY